MNQRITGTETEFGLLIKPDRNSEFGYSEYHVRNVINDYSPLNKPISGFYDNGCRNYVDHGPVLEYATAEDTSIQGTVASEIAGERTVFQTLENARRDGCFYDFDLNKRLIDDAGNSWGHHENYLVSRRKVPIREDRLALLGLHLATINLFTGAGAVLSNKSGHGSYVIAQKALDIRKDFGTTTTDNKALVNMRDEPLAANVRWARIHVTSGDANMSPWAMAMRLGTISLVLRLIEFKYSNSHLVPETQLHKVGLQVATDLTLKQTVELTNGKKTRPIDIQSEIMMAAKSLSSKTILNSEEEWTLREWERACQDLKTEPELLADRVDWVAKMQFLDSYSQRHKANLASQEMRDMDKLWANLGPHGLGNKLRRGTWAQWMPPQELITSRASTAPETTRAKVRALFIKGFSNAAYDVKADWNVVQHRNKHIHLSDPYATENQEVNKLLRVA